MDVIIGEGVIPVIIGNAYDAALVAKKVYRLSGYRAHIFSERFNLLQRMKYKCHRVLFSKEHVVERYLIDFAIQLEEFNTPILICCDEFSKAFVERRREKLEPYYIIVDNN